jgi:hypothetical protein
MEAVQARRFQTIVARIEAMIRDGEDPARHGRVA